MSLYRKYRPLDFPALQGQDHIRDILLGALKNDRVSHAYLFTGPRGTGKTSTARIMARAINCVDLKSSGPCNACMLCKGALEESLTDLVEIDAASHGLVDDARALVEQARFMPTQAKKKIYVIDEVHMLSKSAFNALLKIIEEPPEHVHFILATTEAHKVLDTIKSRCQRFDFHLADEKIIADQLKKVCDLEKVKADSAALHLLAQHARGSFRDALSLLEQVIGNQEVTLEVVHSSLGISDQTSLDDFLKCLFEADKDGALKIVHQMYDQGADLSQFCQSVLVQLRGELLKSDKNPQLIISWIDVFFLALDQLRDTFIPELPLELAVLKCLQVSQPLPPVADVQQVVKPRKLTTAVPVPQQPSPTASVPIQAEDDPSKSETPVGFQLDQFLAALSSVSLRSLLKHSVLNFSGDVLKVQARSTFELDKIREASHQNQISEVLRTMLGKSISLQFEVASDAKPNLPSSQGLSNNDLQSVFS
jgi:DNA polymerase III subunit gamma/tau